MVHGRWEIPYDTNHHISWHNIIRITINLCCSVISYIWWLKDRAGRRSTNTHVFTILINKRRSTRSRFFLCYTLQNYSRTQCMCCVIPIFFLYDSLLHNTKVPLHTKAHIHIFRSCYSFFSFSLLSEADPLRHFLPYSLQNILYEEYVGVSFICLHLFTFIFASALFFFFFFRRHCLNRL